MKIIHCADLHLDSKLNTHLTLEKRKERRAELVQTFRRKIQYGKEQQVEAILIAGDLFDRNVVSESVVRSVSRMIKDCPEICFYYLKGNHDDGDIFHVEEQIPDNLKLFDRRWTYYTHPG